MFRNISGASAGKRRIGLKTPDCWQLCRILIAVALVVVVLGGASSAPVQAQSIDSGVDVALVLDDSGSTSGVGGPATDPSGRRCLAGQLLSDLLDDSDGLGVIRFATTAATTVPYGRADTATRALANQKLSTCSGQGDTNYTQALQLAYDQLDRAPENRPKIVIFATDGEPTVGGGHDEIMALASRFASRGWRIFPVSFDVALDPGLLEQIAETTGGRYTQARRPEDIPDIFQRIFAGQKDLVYLPSQPLCADRPFTRTVADTAESALFTVLYPPDAHLDVQPPPGAQILRRSDRRGSSGLGYAIISAASPAGTWQFNLDGNQCGTVMSGTRYATQVNILAPGDVALTGQPLDLRVDFQLRDSRTNTYAFDPSVSLHADLQRRDADGQLIVEHQDLTAADGAFTGTFGRIANAGIVELDLRAEKDGELIYESASPKQIELVDPPRVSLTQPSGRLSLAAGDPVPLQVTAESRDDAQVQNITATVTDAAGQQLGQLPLAQAAPGTWTAQLAAPGTGDYGVDTRVATQLRGNQLGKISAAALSLPHQQFHVDQSPLDLRLSPQAPGADSSVPLDVIAESGGTRAPVTNLHGNATIVGPDGQQQSAPLTPNGDHLTLTAQPWASGDYQISVSVDGNLAGKPFQTQRDTVTHWTVPPRVTVDSLEQSDLGLIWTAEQLLPTQALRVSSNSDAPITMTASTDDPSLQVTLSQATIPPLATNYPVEVQPAFASIPDEGSHVVSLDIHASQPGNNTIAVAPVQPFVGAIHYTRPGLAARLLHDFGGLIALGLLLLIGAIVGFFVWRSRVPDAAVGLLSPVGDTQGMAIQLQEARRSLSHRLFRRDWIRLCGPYAEVPLHAPGNASLHAVHDHDRVRCLLVHDASSVASPYRVESPSGTNQDIPPGAAAAVEHGDRITFGPSAEYVYTNSDSAPEFVGAEREPDPATAVGAHPGARPPGWL
jgi:hypothetical protein